MADPDDALYLSGEIARWLYSRLLNAGLDATTAQTAADAAGTAAVQAAQASLAGTVPTVSVL